MSPIYEGESIKEAVRRTYGGIARSIDGGSPRASCCCSGQGPTSCCGPAPAASCSATRLYSLDELDGLPPSVSDVSLGCGNPTAIAELRPGETVLDLGSGGGIDCFLAARAVGPQGLVIGLDMTPEMVELARQNARQIGAANVEFRCGEIENIPLDDESVDVVISNCVINLSPDKDAVFRQAYRVLRPGGRMVISDIAVERALPPAVSANLDAWAGCLAGALVEDDYLAKIRAAGFGAVETISRTCIPLGQSREWQTLAALLAEAGFTTYDLDHTVVELRVRALK